MRSQTDPFFSDLCDRVARGSLTESDEKYLQSRVQLNDSENLNEPFKVGRLLIVVTTNKKKDLINSHKLSQLLPGTKEFVCNCVDRVVNLPGNLNKTEKEIRDLEKVGSLPKKLILKIGAPVVVHLTMQKANIGMMV